jgi:hypothetical protein
VDANRLGGVNIDVDDLESIKTVFQSAHSNKSNEPTTTLNPLAEPGYCGHFVVLCGFDTEADLIFYRNPACSQRLSCTNSEQFEQARKSYGTDEDILFIYA